MTLGSPLSLAPPFDLLPAAARIVQVCDGVAERLRELNPGVAVVRTFGLDLPDGGPDELTIYVLPRRYGQTGPGARAADQAGYGVAVLVAQRFDPPAADAEVEALIARCERQVYDPLADARAPRLPEPCESLWPREAEVVQVYDPDDLRRGLFVCEMAFDFDEIA